VLFSDKPEINSLNTFALINYKEYLPDVKRLLAIPAKTNQRPGQQREQQHQAGIAEQRIEKTNQAAETEAGKGQGQET